MLTTRRRTRRLVPAAAAGALALTAAVAPAASAANGDPVTIDLYGINDFHGRLEATGYGVAGAAVLAGALDQFRTANPNTLFVSAGDNVGASTFTSFIQHDDPTLDALNAAGLDVSALGNHEFDQGRVDVDDHLTQRAAFRTWPRTSSTTRPARTPTTRTSSRTSTASGSRSSGRSPSTCPRSWSARPGSRA